MTTQIQRVSVRKDESSKNDLRNYGGDNNSKRNEGMDKVGNDCFRGDDDISESGSNKSLDKKKSESSSSSSRIDDSLPKKRKGEKK